MTNYIFLYLYIIISFLYYKLFQPRHFYVLFWFWFLIFHVSLVLAQLHECAFVSRSLELILCMLSKHFVHLHYKLLSNVR